MHEVSIVMRIIDIATEALHKEGGQAITGITMDIGSLSSIEQDSFDFAWDAAVKDTPLALAERKVNHIPARGRCCQCGHACMVQSLYDDCPICHHRIEIFCGKELSVKSIEII